MNRAWPWAVAGVSLLGALIRFPLLFTGFFIDEIWTLSLLTLVKTPAAILVALRHDNNHWLNSFYLYAVRAADSAPVYRLLSFVTGVATLALVAAIGKRHSRAAGLLMATGCAASFLLADLTTQARGYSPAMFFAAAAYLLLDRYLEKGGDRYRFGFQIAVALGVLSHLTFLVVYGALVVWSLEHVRRKRESLRRIVDLHAPILIFLVALYFVGIQGLLIGGAPTLPISKVLRDFLYWVFGAPSVWWAIPLGAICTGECVRMYREGREEWAFFAGAIVSALASVPASYLAPLSPRHFTLLIPFFFLPLARFTARLRWASLLVVGAFLAAQAPQFADFYRFGRGDYAGAAAFLSAAGGVVGADPTSRYADFQTAMPLWYYGPKIPFISRKQWESGAPDWMVVPRPGETAAPPPVLERMSRRFRLVRHYHGSGATAMDWGVYRREP
jgi:hypothetical protein